MDWTPKYKRVLLKLSGEALMGSSQFGISQDVLSAMAQQIGEICQLSVQVALVIGAGNIFRGVAASARGMNRVTADTLGMLGTVMNALAMQDALEREGVRTCLQSALPIQAVGEPVDARRAVENLEQGRVVLFAAGTGHPYFTTDTAACLRALEIDAQVMLKATKVDGVYSSDPVTNREAVLFDQISYDDVLSQNLRVMDATAIALCKENGLPIIVFNLTRSGNIRRVVLGEKIGTVVSATHSAEEVK